MIDKTFEVDGPADIEVRIESGRVEVHRGAPGRVHVSVDTKTPDFIVEQRGNSILVSSELTMSWLSRSSAYVVIEAPEGSDLKVEVASAEVRADLPLGKADLKTASGDVELDRVESLTVKSASGDVDVEKVEHSLAFTSASGDLRVRDSCQGSIGVSTASGDVHIEDCEASINFNTASGDVYVRRFTGRNASFKGMSGDVELGIPRLTEVELDANLLSGKLRLPDPEPDQGEPERQMSLKAKLVSGNMTINRV